MENIWPNKTTVKFSSNFFSISEANIRDYSRFIQIRVNLPFDKTIYCNGFRSLMLSRWPNPFAFYNNSNEKLTPFAVIRKHSKQNVRDMYILKICKIPSNMPWWKFRWCEFHLIWSHKSTWNILHSNESVIRGG